MPQSLAVTADEEGFLANGNLEAFWFSRLKKRDPAFWNRKGFAYWELLARSTVVNLATGLERAGQLR